MTDRWEVTDGARGVIYADDELRNAKISASRRSRGPGRVRVIDMTSGSVVAEYRDGHRIQEPRGSKVES